MSVSRRWRAASCGALLLTTSLVAGCAKFDGDKAKFCAELPKAPSFMSIALQTMTGSADKAADQLDDAAAQFRSLEHLAPRTIRVKVSTIGDATERLAFRFRKDQPPPLSIEDYGNSLSSDDYEALSGSWNQRQNLFLDELTYHPSVGAAAASLMTYASDECGIEDPQNPLGMFGSGGYYGQSYFGQGVPTVVEGSGASTERPAPTPPPAPLTVPQSDDTAPSPNLP